MSQDRTKPVGTLVELEEYGLEKRRWGSCAPRHEGSGVPEDQRQKGCPMWKECTLNKIKGRSGPVNLPFRVLKEATGGGGIAREGWGPCFDVFRLREQFKVNQAVVFEIFGAEGDTVETRGTRPKKNDVGLPVLNEGNAVWEDYIESETVPPFQRLGEAKTTKTQQYMKKVRDKMQAATLGEQRAKLIGAPVTVPDDEDTEP